MKTNKAGTESNKQRASVLPEAFSQPTQLLPALFDASCVGLAIIDQHLCFQAINGALAVMNGVPAEAHLGKPLRHILGNAASKIEPMFRRVFSTGERINFELSEKLPTRAEAGQWVADFFPIRDAHGKVIQVGVVVVEVTGKEKLEKSLNNLFGKLLLLQSALKMDMCGVPKSGGRRENESVRNQYIDLVNRCVFETRTIWDELQSIFGKDAAPAQVRQSRFLAAASATFQEDLPIARAYPAQRVNSLSPRERQIVQLLGESKNNKEISAKLGISVRTAETHRARIMLKLNLHSVTELVRYAVRNHIIEA